MTQTFEEYLRQNSDKSAAADYPKGHFFKPHLRLYPSLNPDNQVTFYVETGLRNIAKIVRSPDFIISASDQVLPITTAENPQQFLEDLKLDRSLEEVAQGWGQPSDVTEEIPNIIGCAIAQAIRDAKGKTYEGSRLEHLALLVEEALERGDYSKPLSLARLILREAAEHE